MMALPATFLMGSDRLQRVATMIVRGVAAAIGEPL
jgi:hypothetical protein